MNAFWFLKDSPTLNLFPCGNPTLLLTSILSLSRKLFVLGCAVWLVLLELTIRLDQFKLDQFKLEQFKLGQSNKVNFFSFSLAQIIFHRVVVE